MLVFVLKNYRFAAVRLSLGRDNGPMRMQRRPRCNAVRPPLQTREGLTARLFQRSCFSAELLSFANSYE